MNSYIIAICYNGNRSFIQYLPVDFQKKILTTKEIEYNQTTPNSKKVRGYIYNYPLNESIQYFSEEVILTTALEQIEKKDGFSDILNLMDIKYLPEITQMKLLFLGNELYTQKVAPEILYKYVNNNPLLFRFLTNEQKISLVDKNPSLLKNMSYSFQYEYVKTHDVNASEVDIVDMKTLHNSEDVKKKMVLRENCDAVFGGDDIEILDHLSEETLIELSKFSVIWSSNNSDKNIIVQKILPILVKNVQKIDNNEDLFKYLSQIQVNNYDWKDDVNKIANILKLVSNDEVLKKIDGNLILELVNSKDSSKLIELIRNVYGDKSAKILEDRPNINLEEIPNLYIFDTKIVEEFGIGAIHASLAYKNTITGMFSEFARFPEKLEQYQIFNNVTHEMFEDTAEGLQKKIKAFVMSEELMKNVNFQKLTDTQKKNLQVAFMEIDLGYLDTAIGKKEYGRVLEFPKDKESLESYISNRNKIYDEAIRKDKHLPHIKQNMAQRFFGMDYDYDIAKSRELRNPTVINMCSWYGIKDFVNDKQNLEHGEFTNDDLDALEILDIFSKITDVGILRELHSILRKSDYVIEPIHYQELKTKVPLQYTRDIVDNLFSYDKARDMISSGVPGIEMRKEDDINIVTLKGADFTAYITNPFMNNSRIGAIEKGDYSKLVDIWKNKEKGISTFSGCLIDQDEIKSTVGTDDIGLGFSNLSAEQIVGMGITDINTSHDLAQLSVTTGNIPNIKYEKSKEFMRRTALRLEVEGTDKEHLYNEIASLRRNQRLADIKEGTYGGRIMPDYIYIVGEKHIETAKKYANLFGIDTIVQLEEELYRDRGLARANQKKEIFKKREETSFIREVKSGIGEDDGER